MTKKYIQVTWNAKKYLEGVSSGNTVYANLLTPKQQQQLLKTGLVRIVETPAGVLWVKK